jgi:glycerol-3-phosphate O-acyltransferase
MKPADQERILVEVQNRVVERHMREADHRPEGYLEEVIQDTLYHENLRLEDEDPSKPDVRRYVTFYDQLRKRLTSASRPVLHAALSDLAHHFAAEVLGNFSEAVYRFSTSVIPHGLSVVLKAANARHALSPRMFRGDLSEHLLLQGAVEQARALHRKGTTVFVPTHVSNLDSVVMGYSIFLLGIPPVLYGAGLNLFSNPLLAFFMRNLGAYRVDRRKKAGLYKDVLKEYSTVALELGYHSLFFPGGTRSRSGSVERDIKKGLLGTAVTAYGNNLRAGRVNPNIYVVPCTISYRLVLEAETLIRDHLAEVGKSRYIIEDDESSKPRKVLNFLSQILALEDRIVLTFSKPLDVLGNPVDDDGRSLDPQGRTIDPRTYMQREGEVVEDDDRDTQYTHELADAIGASFLRDNMVMATQVVAHSLFRLLQKRNPNLDLYRLLRTGGDQASFPIPEVQAEVGRTIDILKSFPEEKGPRLDPSLTADTATAGSILDDGLRHFGTYHTRPAAERRGDRVFHGDRNLLYFYSNRLRGYDLGRIEAGGAT